MPGPQKEDAWVTPAISESGPRLPEVPQAGDRVVASLPYSEEPAAVMELRNCGVSVEVRDYEMSSEAIEVCKAMWVGVWAGGRVHECVGVFVCVFCCFTLPVVVWCFGGGPESLQQRVGG